MIIRRKLDGGGGVKHKPNTPPGSAVSWSDAFACVGPLGMPRPFLYTMNKLFTVYGNGRGFLGNVGLE